MLRAKQEQGHPLFVDCKRHHCMVGQWNPNAGNHCRIPGCMWIVACLQGYSVALSLSENDFLSSVCVRRPNQWTYWICSGVSLITLRLRWPGCRSFVDPTYSTCSVHIYNPWISMARARYITNSQWTAPHAVTGYGRVKTIVADMDEEILYIYIYRDTCFMKCGHILTK